MYFEAHEQLMTSQYTKAKRVLRARQRKASDFRRIVIYQIIVITLLIPLKDVLMAQEADGGRSLIRLPMLAIAGVYLYLLWDLNRAFSPSKWVPWAVLVLLMVTAITAIITENPIYWLEGRAAEYYIIHLCWMSIEISALILAGQAIFTGQHSASERLWGSACIYLTMAMAFGSVYDLINVALPGAFGEDIPNGIYSYLSGITMSISTLGGIDSPYPEASRAIRDVATIESLAGNLYVVFLIGRIMGVGSGSKS